jgi:cytochrome c oxidase cbb3-type subunit 2
LRGWGRASVPADYAYDYPHLLGVSRTGPDLFNIGARQPSVDWHLTHLYQPRSVTPGSVMPAYPFLFKVVKHPTPGDKVVTLPPQYVPVEGKVVATQQALDLVAYLTSLNHTYPIADNASGAAK